MKVLLTQLQSSLPASVRVQILTDRTETIRASVADVQFELADYWARSHGHLSFPAEPPRYHHSECRRATLTGRDVWSDVSAGIQPNNLTLMALTISTGFVVDDAIVMIENIDDILRKANHRCRRP